MNLIEIGKYVMDELKVDSYDKLYECLNFGILYKILRGDFKKLFGCRTIDFVRKCYPGWKVCSWKFKSPLKYQWTDIENRRFAVCEYIKEQEGWTCRNDFYKLNIKIVEKHLKKGFMDYYQGRLYDVLMDLLPPKDPSSLDAEDIWFPWMIGDQSAIIDNSRGTCRSTPKRLWEEVSNRKWYIEWLCNKKNYAIPDDLHRLVKNDFIQNYGMGMLTKCYRCCVSRCLQSIFPEHIEKLQWFMFKRKPTNSFKNETELICAMNYLRLKNGWVAAEQFYELSAEDFATYGLRGLVKRGETFADSVIRLNPDLTFEKSKFNRHKTEELVMKILKNLKFEYRSHVVVYKSSSGGEFRMDIIIPSLKLYIEIDGNQHFKGQLEAFQRLGWEVHLCRDVFKMKEALKSGMSVIRIVQMECWNGKEEWFKTNIVPYIKLYDTPTIKYVTTTEKYKDCYNHHQEYIDKPISEDDMYV